MTLKEYIISIEDYFIRFLGAYSHALRVIYGFGYSNSALENGMFASHEVSLCVLLGEKRKIGVDF